MRLRSIVVGGAVLTLAATVAPGAWADFPEDPPDDPLYDRSEESFPLCDVPPIDQQYQLFSFMPACGPLASDPEDASGNSVDAVWRDFTIGRPDVLIAYIEGGINWHEDGDSGVVEIADMGPALDLSLALPPTPGGPDGGTGPTPATGGGLGALGAALLAAGVSLRRRSSRALRRG